ncbi:MAG: methyltransferase domain-containing protein [Planctomycetota bacterium]|nr:methyltransferase domain-containing protein [Planctomycetota bacterium]
MSELNEIQRNSQAQFDRQSARYGRQHILADVQDVTELVRLIPQQSRRRALDIATGAGHTGLYLAEHGWQVTLADISSGMLEQASKAAAERGLTVETRQHTAEVLPYPDESFELVSCRVAAHHFSDPAAFVRESARVLTSGGAFLLIDGSVADDQIEAEEWLHQVEKLRDPSHHRFLSPGRWQQLCQEAGLNVIQSGLQPMLQPDLQWYFETANTSAENRRAVLELVAAVPQSARELFQLAEDQGKITWYWQRLSLLALKP